MNTGRRRRLVMIVLLAVMVGLFVASLAAPASAELKTGSCTGSGTFSDGLVVDETTPESTVIEVPREDTVAWEGKATRAPADADVEIPFSGAVQAKIGFFWITIRSWGGTAQPGADANMGTYTYEVPDIVPGTGEIKVRATHDHGSAPQCMGVWTMKLDGGPGVVGVVAAAGTALFGAVLLTSGITKKVTS
jgi:hypothetical protein